jgi:nicotinamidase-related amidase
MIAALSHARAALLVIDIQERLAAAMDESDLERVVKNTKILIETARRLGLPIVVSQQYPKGLGPTLPAIEDALAGAPKLHRFDKLEFSAAAAPEFPKIDRDQWIVCGMEAHVCVYQTARGLVTRGHDVHVALDAICSRTEANWNVARGLLERTRAIPSSTETIVFDLLERAGSDDFKALSKLVK